MLQMHLCNDFCTRFDILFICLRILHMFVHVMFNTFMTFQKSFYLKFVLQLRELVHEFVNTILFLRKYHFFFFYISGNNPTVIPKILTFLILLKYIGHYCWTIFEKVIEDFFQIRRFQIKLNS